MRTTIQYIGHELRNLYPDSEIEAVTRLIIEKVCGWNFTEQLINKTQIISLEKVEIIRGIAERLKQSEPIQYILGETEFYGSKLFVNSSVLIPRPETEELVNWICESGIKKSASVLDVGTGSGCIAIALKKFLNNAKVTAIDISEKALETAKKNADFNTINIDFIKTDILKWEEFSWKNFDVIVSNPPYVTHSEKKQMNANVREFEPENALFVSDENPLVFYRRIAEFANKYLINGGMLFFEINENLSLEMTEMLNFYNFENMQIKKDINGKNRMIRCNSKNKKAF